MRTKLSSSHYTAVLVCIIGALAYACTGCMTINPEKFERQYKSWVPVGTSASDAERIMNRRGFKCWRGKFPSERPWAGPLLRCRRENHFLNRTWDVDFFLQDDRVVGYESRMTADFLRLAPGP